MRSVQEREIVVFRYRKGLRIGLHLETAQSKSRVETEKGRAFTVPSENLIFSTQRTAVDHGELKAFTRQVEKLAAEIDLEELWELVRDETEAYGFEELAELYWDAQTSPDRYAALIWHLHSDGCPFFDDAGERYRPVAEDVVAEHKERTRRQAEEASEESSFLLWLNRESDELTPESMSPRQRSRLERLVDFVVSVEDTQQNAWAKAFLARIRKGGDLRRFAFDLLVSRGVLGADENLDLRRCEVPIDFPDEATAAAAACDHGPALGDSARRDLRDREVFSIDGETTTDVDDALSLRATEDGYELGIHITDLSVSIAEGTTLDRVARGRLVSFYFPERRIPMLPESLSSGSGSLLEGEERPVLSLLARFDHELQLTGAELVQGRIVNHHQLTYDRVDALLEGESHPLTERIVIVDRIARACRQRRVDAGAVEFDRPEVTIEVGDDGGSEVRVNCTSRETAANRLVSEMMILYNLEVAKYSIAQGIPFVDRTQAAASQPLPDGPIDAYQRFVFFKGVAPSQFSLEPDHHHLLGVERYSQVSSPLRRYMDLIAQRQLVHAVRTGTAGLSAAALGLVVHEADERLRELGRLEFARQRYWLLKYLASRHQESFEACVLDVRERDCLVELDGYGLRAPATPAGEVKPGDSVTVQVSHIDHWDQHVRFRMV